MRLSRVGADLALEVMLIGVNEHEDEGAGKGASQRCSKQ
jgi:hypothetical protein